MMQESAINVDGDGWADFESSSSIDFTTIHSPPPRTPAPSHPSPASPAPPIISGGGHLSRGDSNCGAEWQAEETSVTRSPAYSTYSTQNSVSSGSCKWPNDAPSVADELEDGSETVERRREQRRSLSTDGNLMQFEQDQEVFSNGDFDTRSDSEYQSRLTEMEQEQEMLNASLMSLTTHFAQVQFRLQQISLTSDVQAKEKLIKELELFAFEGCPDVRGITPRRASLETTDEDHSQNYERQTVETKELIQRLQRQLTDVEQWAYESGQSEAPSLAVLEKQRLILSTLQDRVKLSLDGLENLSPEEMRQKVDDVIESIISPYRKKELAQERTLNNLQTFVDDLERYIQHIHKDPSSPGSGSRPPLPTLTVVKKEKERKKAVTFNDPTASAVPGSLAGAPVSLRSRASRTYSVLQFVAWSNWSCLSQRRFQKNVMKATTKGNHWGDARAVLELAISKVLDLTQERAKVKVRRSGHAANAAEQNALEEQLSRAIRKDLTSALCTLMQHGLADVSNERSLVPQLVCVARRSEPVEFHPWDLIIKYYKYKKGEEFNRSATRRLADSFQLSSVGSRSISSQEQLLASVGDILDAHNKLQRSPLTLLKAFVCSALNEKTLSTWLRIIYCTQPIVEECYQPWSYAYKTHFEDACQSLDNLSTFHFHLPADLAVRPFKTLAEAF